MNQNTLCTPEPVNDKKMLDMLLKDKRGQDYYDEMRQLKVDTAALKKRLEDTCRSRIRTWLAICAHCGMCADACAFYLSNHKDPTQVPSYKIQSTLGEIVKRKGNVDNTFMLYAMDVAWGDRKSVV